MSFFGVGAQRIDIPKTVHFWVVQHPQTKKYANIWGFYHMGWNYGGHVWETSLKEALPFLTEDRAREWWLHNKRSMGWSDLDSYMIGIPDFVHVEVAPEELQKDRTDSLEILYQLKEPK